MAAARGPRARPDDGWDSYGPTRAVPAGEGIATSRQRGDMAGSWWSGRLVDLLDSYGLGGRMQRGRRYARRGQLVGFEVEPGLVTAQVQGSALAPYRVTVATTAVTATQWEAVDRAMAARSVFVAQLLAGQVPPELEAVFDEAGVPLLPRRWTDLSASCSCPDRENPCKHIAAVLYVFADRLDDDPWLLLRWRGRERDEVLAPLRLTPPASPEIAPWWPLTPGAPLPPDDTGRTGWTLDDPAAALARLGPLDVAVRPGPAAGLLTTAYEALAATPPDV